MDNVMQFLFNTNHEQPSILVWVLLIVIAVVIPNYVRYRMEQKRSNDSVPTQNPARSAPRKAEMLCHLPHTKTAPAAALCSAGAVRLFFGVQMQEVLTS